MARKKGQLSLSSRINFESYRLVFRVLSTIRPPRAETIRLTPESRVLVFSTAGLGDSLFDSAGIRSVAESWPGITIDVVCHHRRPDIARHNPFVRHVHLFRKGPHAFALLWQKLRRCGPWDTILYFSCHDPEVRSLGYLLAPGRTVGWEWTTRMPWLCAHRVGDASLQRAHFTTQCAAIAAAAGAERITEKMVFTVHPADRQALDQRLSALGFPQTPAVTCQLGGGGGPFRDWPVEHFVSLLRQLHSVGVGPIFLLGGGDHRRKCEKILAATAALGIPLHDVVGKLPLAESAALIERSRTLVTTDTGIMHLAFAIGTPTVALLHCTPGPTRVGPQAEPWKHEVIALPKPPGYQKPADASMSAIPPQAVFEAVQRVLSR